jgi:hypothetical protein
MERYERKDGIVLERRGLAPILGAIGVVVPFLAMKHFDAASPAFLMLLLTPLASTILALLAFYRWPRRRRAHVVVDERGLTLDGSLACARHRFRNAFALTLPDGPAIHLDGRLRAALSILVADEREGESILRALRLDTAHATATFPAIVGGKRAWMWRVIAWMVAALALSIGVIFLRDMSPWLHAMVPGWIGQPMMWLPYAVLFARGMVRVTVGSDGVLVRPYLGKGRYIPYADIESTALDNEDLVLELRSGARLLLGVGSRQSAGGEYKGDALLRRIEAGRLVPRADEGERQPATLVARGGRSVRSWMAGLREIAEAARATYRRPVVPSDQFWLMVEDASCPLDVRAGAAVALSTALDDAGRERLRVVSETCASPRLRVALEAVRSGTDDAVLEQALNGITSDAPSVRRSRP